MEKTYTTEQAAQEATEWCKKNPGWQRICDIPDHDSLYETWDELPARVKKYWERECRSDAEGAWREFGAARCKVKFGHVSGAGEFYKCILDVPRFHQGMMVFKVGKP